MYPCHFLNSFCGYVTPPPGVIVGSEVDNELTDYEDINDKDKKQRLPAENDVTDNRQGNKNKFSKESDTSYKHNRVKRQQGGGSNNLNGKTRCSLLLVADYKFYKEMGQGNKFNTINYVVSINFWYVLIVFKI